MTEAIAIKYELGNPAHIEKFSKVLQDYIKKNKLSMNIQGNEYVKVDGWKFAGVSFGIVPIPKKPIRIESPEGTSMADKELRYECEVDLVQIATQMIVGHGFSVCSSKEKNRAGADAFVLSAMSQTRAIGRAFKNLLGFIMMSAGYAETPYEEMDGVKTQNNPAKDQDTSIPEDTIQAIKDCKTIKELEAVVNPLNLLHNHIGFRTLVNDKKSEINEKAKS